MKPVNPLRRQHPNRETVMSQFFTHVHGFSPSTLFVIERRGADDYFYHYTDRPPEPATWTDALFPWDSQYIVEVPSFDVALARHEQRKNEQPSS